MLGLFRAALQHTETDHHDYRYGDPQQHRLEEQSLELGAKRLITSGHFLTLTGGVGVVQLLDLLRDGQRSLPSGYDLAPEKGSAAHDFFCRGPVEERIKSGPVVIQPRL